MKHKLLSILLCLAMALSLLPTAALAEETVTYPARVQNERELRYALYSAPVNGTQATIKLTSDITLKMLYAAENFGTEKLEDNAAGDTFNRYKLGVHPTAEDPNHWNPLVTNQTQEQRVVYGAYYHMSATDERIARLVVKAGQNIELDLNGHTIQKAARATHGDWSKVCTDIIGNYGTLTVIDSSTGETKGTIKGNGYISCDGAVLHNYAGATMTVGAVNVDGNAEGMTAGTGQYVIANDGGTITINGTNIYDTATSASLLVNTAGTMTVQNNAVLNHPNTKTINAKGGNVTVENATISSDRYAIFATDNSKVTINSGVTINGTGTVKKDKNTAMVNNTGAELPVPAGYEWVEESGKQTLKMNAAVVGGVNYPTLADAFEALNKTNHPLTLIDGHAWDAEKPVYWQAGTESGYVAKLTDALTAAYKANASDITIVCRPGADVGEMTHGHVAYNLTIYGNNAFISGGECDLEVEQYTFIKDGARTEQSQGDGSDLTGDITITAYEMDNLGVWGTRRTTHKVNIVLTDCDSKALTGKTNVQRVYINGTTGVNDITLTGCDFLTKATAVYSNADGEVMIDNCSFTGGQVPVNFNHTANGTQTVTVKNSTFTNCGDEGEWKQFAAPIRFVNSGSGTSTTTVDNCTFNNTVGNNGDILIGDGQSGKASNNLELTVSGTAANVQAQQPGYYAANGTVAAAGKVSKTTIPASETPTTIKLESNKDFKLAEVNGAQMSSLTDALDYARSSNKPIKLLSADTALVQAILDGQYGSIDGLTIELPTGNYGQLELGRATKYEGSNTEYYILTSNQISSPVKYSYAEFCNIKNNTSTWSGSPLYIRSMSNITLKAASGASVMIAGVNASSGHKYENAHDYVLDRDVANGNTYYLVFNFANITFDGLTFTAKSDINTSLEQSNIDRFTFKNCTFNINNTASGNQAIRYYNENNNGKVSNLVVDNCKFNKCYQGVYTSYIKNVFVTNSEFDTTGHNAIAIQDSNACDHGQVIITGNTFKNIRDRIIRFNNVGADTQITITHNTATNSGDNDGEVIKATSLAEGVNYNIHDNSWGNGKKVANEQLKDTAAPSYSGSGSSDPTYSVSTPSKTEHGGVTVSPKSASKGDTVTVTVKPDSGYVLETLTVTDKNGNELTLKDKGNGKYTFTMPAGKVEVKATFMEDNSMLNFFYDVPNNAYFYEAVKWAVENGITTGVGNDLFAPEQPCTRAQIVTFLWRAAGSPEPKGAASGMTDVVSGSYYEKAVAWAIENGITTGTTTSTFSPDVTCTRAQAVTFLARALKAKAASAAEFSDVPTGSYFADAVAWAAANGVTEGIGGGLFGSDNDCTRGQIVTFLYRAYNK